MKTSAKRPKNAGKPQHQRQANPEGKRVELCGVLKIFPGVSKGLTALCSKASVEGFTALLQGFIRFSVCMVSAGFMIWVLEAFGFQYFAAVDKCYAPTFAVFSLVFNLHFRVFR